MALPVPNISGNVPSGLPGNIPGGVSGGLTTQTSPQDLTSTGNNIKNLANSLNNNNPLQQLGVQSNSSNNIKGFISSLSNSSPVSNPALAFIIPIVKPIIINLISQQAAIKATQFALEQRLKGYGSVTTQGNNIVFTPRPDASNYQQFVSNYNRSISLIRDSLGIAEKGILVATIATGVLNTAASIMASIIQVQKVLITTLQASIAVDQSSPSPVKPITGPATIAITVSQTLTSTLGDKIIQYQKALQSINSILQYINALFALLNGLVSVQIQTINSSNNGTFNPNDFTGSFATGSNSLNSNNQIVSGNYIFTIVRNYDGSRVATATNRITGAIVATTAKAYIETDQQLIQEIQAIVSAF